MPRRLRSTLFPYTTLFRSPLGSLVAEAEAVLEILGQLAEELVAVTCTWTEALGARSVRSEEHTTKLQSLRQLVSGLLREKMDQVSIAGRLSEIDNPLTCSA